MASPVLQKFNVNEEFIVSRWCGTLSRTWQHNICVTSKNLWTPIFGKCEKTLSSNFKNVLFNHCKNSIRFKCVLLKKKVAYWVYHTCNAKELPFSNEVFIEIDATFMQSDNKEHQSSGFKLVSWGTVKRPLPNSN